jgi:hypothetical protein
VLQMLKDSDATVMVDRSAVIVGDNSLDMTALAIKKLDAALPHVDFVLSPTETKQ